MNRTRVKVCGITRAEDARKAVELGTDGLGFIFAGKSPRAIDPQTAWEIIAEIPSFITRVGVFVDEDIDEVKRIVDFCGLSQVQLHGKEPVEYCLQLKKWRRSLLICKAFRVRSETSGTDVNSYGNYVHSILLDTYASGSAGGTGETFDWNIVERLDLQNPLILAGGLSPENVAEAVRMVRPFAVDVNSGVEDRPGIKNHRKMQAMFAAVADADRRR